jgi:hypothetical protein
MAATLTPEAQQLMARAGLGTATAVYKPNTVITVIGWLIMLVLAGAFTVFSFYFIGQNFSSGGGYLGFLVPGIGLLGIIIALVLLARTIGNRHARAAICTNGIACITSKSADAARWQDILTITHGVKVTTTRNQGGGTSSSVRHTFTVHCRDGRKILLDSNVFGGKVQQLGEAIQVELARYNQARGIRP